MGSPLSLTPPDPVQDALQCLAVGDDLTAGQTEAAFGAVMSGTVPHEAMKALLVGLRDKGETPEEVAGVVRALRAAMHTVAHSRPDDLVDTCGTGGGTHTTLNVSTAAAFVAAGAGVPIAKHGNRSHTSRSGSADVLEAMGIAIELTPARAAEVLAEIGLVFLFAPLYHPAMRHLGPVRRELATPTLMNLVGPLANPAGVRRQVVGVADARKAPVVAEALARLGLVHAIVAHGEIGMDEIAPVGTTLIWEVRGQVVEHWRLAPQRFGLATADLGGLEGGSPEENATHIAALFATPASAAPALRAAVLLNAAAAIVVSGQEPDFDRAVPRAAAALETGAALRQLERLRAVAPISTSG